MVDVVEANSSFMDLSEELYDALIESRWQPPDFSAFQEYIISNLPDPISS